MSACSLRVVLIVAMCVSSGALAGERPRYAPTKPNAAGMLATDRGASTDPAAPYKADRLSSSKGQAILDTPGQTTVLTRDVLDDMNATTLRDALRATAGVTVGR